MNDPIGKRVRTRGFARWVSILAILGLLAAGCSYRADPDPGNKHFEVIKQDPALELRHPDLRLIEEEAKERKLGPKGDFFVDFGDPPYVRLRFEPVRPMTVDSILDWYDARVSQIDWEPSPIETEVPYGERNDYKKQVDGSCLSLFIDVSFDDQDPRDVLAGPAQLYVSGGSCPDD